MLHLKNVVQGRQKGLTHLNVRLAGAQFSTKPFVTRMSGKIHLTRLNPLWLNKIFMLCHCLLHFLIVILSSNYLKALEFRQSKLIEKLRNNLRLITQPLIPFSMKSLELLTISKGHISQIEIKSC